MKKSPPPLFFPAPSSSSLSAALAALVALLVALSGCAEGDPALGPDPASFPDVGGRDTSAISPDTGAPPAPDTSGSDAECGPVCCANQVSCVDEATVGQCNPTGTLLVPTPCGEGEECVEGACVTAPVCQAGQTRCHDASTLLTCRPAGNGYATMACEEGTTCSQGRCLAGGANGSACEADDSCASGSCRCGPSTDDACPGEPTTGYCAAPGCDASSCPADAACLQADLAPLGAAAVDYDHCVQRCASGACDDPSLSCVRAPVAAEEGVEWALVCYLPGYVRLGVECGPDAPCIGGSCLSDYYDTSYCTRRCDDDGVCPEGYGCVALRPGEFYCSELCGNGSPLGAQDCPFDEANRFDVTCRTLPSYDGASLRACATPT